MKPKTKKQKQRDQLTGFLLANFGHSVGIDVVSFLQKDKDMMKGRRELYKSKAKKKKLQK